MDKITGALNVTVPIQNTTDPSGNIYFSGNLMPTQHNVFDIGSTGMAWHSLFVSAHTIFVDGTPISSQSGTIVMPLGSTIGGVNPGTIKIMGGVSSESGLLTTGATAIGDGYMVSGFNPAHLFVLQVGGIGAGDISSNWVDIGAIAGPQGIQGTVGPAEIGSAVSPQISHSVQTATPASSM